MKNQERTQFEWNSLAEQWRQKHQAPPEMEARLLAQFRKKQVAPLKLGWTWVAVAAALILGLLTSLIAVNKLPRESAVATVKPQPAVVNIPHAPEVSPSIRQVAEVPVAKKSPFRRRPEQVDSQAQPTPVSLAGTQEIYTDFFALESGTGPFEIERGRVMRVSMPRSALIRVGLPVNMDRINDSIQADLVLNEEGIARAVRFIQ